jgi:hypothetical protein
VAVGAGVFAAVVLAQRLYDLPLPLIWIGVGLGGAVVIVSIILAIVKRDSVVFAAAKLDEAAGLKERISSGHFCADASDPFAQAVLADAERVSTSLSVRQHIRLSTPDSLLWSGGAILVAALMFLITPGLLKSGEAEAAENKSRELEQAKVAVKRKFDAIRDLAEETPALEDLKNDIEGLDKRAGGELRDSGQIRHEAVKKIDKLADAVKQKRQSEQYEAAKEMRKMMRALKVPKSSDAPTQKLARALAQGDFKTAKEEINALKEQLATLKSEQDKELVTKLGKQLENLSKQLERLSQDKKLAQKLEQAGIKKEDLDRLLENLKKKDLDQLKKQLAEKGFSQQEIDKIAKQLQKKQLAGNMAKSLANAMKQGGQCQNSGQTGEAIAGLSAAADQLSELEQLEQEMSQLDATLTALQDARNDLDNPCPACNGTGKVGGKPCGKCQGKRGGMGKLGRGRGGLAPEEQTDIDFKVERAKVHTGRGAIIGQLRFDGEQVKGEVTSNLADVITAAERDATDRIDRDRVPRQYQKAVKAYFSNVQRSVRDGKDKPTAAAPDQNENKGAAGDSQEQTTSENGED